MVILHRWMIVVRSFVSQFLKSSCSPIAGSIDLSQKETQFTTLFAGKALSCGVSLAYECRSLQQARKENYHRHRYVSISILSEPTCDLHGLGSLIPKTLLRSELCVKNLTTLANLSLLKFEHDFDKSAWLIFPAVPHSRQAVLREKTCCNQALRILQTRSPSA